MRAAKECKARRFVAFCAALSVAMLAAVPGAWAAQPAVEGEDDATGFNRVDPQWPRAKPAPRAMPITHTEPVTRGPSRYDYILAQVGPDIIFQQDDQDCAGIIHMDSFASSMGFLRNVEPPGGIGADYWNADGTEPTPAFICSGNQHLYWLDRISGIGTMNGIELKYWTTVSGACADNYVKVHFRNGVDLPEIGSYISNPGEYTMGPMPINIHPPPDPAGQTNYVIMMSMPSSWGSAEGAKPGWLVAELLDAGEPVHWCLTNLVEGSQVETWEPSWLQTYLPLGGNGVAMSLSEGWNGDADSSDDETMGWFLAGRDLQGDTWLDGFTWLDKDRDQWTDPVGGGTIASYYYGGTNCAPGTPPEETRPEASMYTVLWCPRPIFKRSCGPNIRHFPEPNDQFNLNSELICPVWDGMQETGITDRLKQGCMTTFARIDAHGGNVIQPGVTDPFLDVDIYHVQLTSHGPITIGGEQYCRRSLLRVDIDSDQPIDLLVRLWDSTYQELLLGDALRHQDGTIANTDPPRVLGEPNFGEDVLVPSLDPLLVFDGMYCDPVDSSTTITDDYFIGVSWEQNDDYDPSAANSGTVVGDLETQGDQIGYYYMRIATGFLTRQADAATVVDELDDDIAHASGLIWLAPGTYTSGQAPDRADLGGNHMFRGHDLDFAGPLLNASCVGDLDIYEVPEIEYADGYGIHARVESVAIGGNNMACAIYRWDEVNTPELVAVGDDTGMAPADTDPVAYTTMTQADIDAGYKWYVAVLGVGAWDSADAGNFWYALNGFVDTVPIDITIPGTDDQNTGGQGYYELTVTVGPHSDVAHPSAPSQPWEPNDSFAQADARGLLPDQLGGGSPMNGVPAGQLHARYASVDDPAIGGEPQGGGIYLGDGVHGESATVDQGGDVDIYVFGANEGEVVEINVDASSSLTPVNPERGLVSRCYLFDHERTLVETPDLYIGQYDTVDGCSGYRNISTTLQHPIPRTGTYYAVVVGADMLRPYPGAQLPYDLHVAGTVRGGKVEHGTGAYCPPAAHVGFYDLTVELTACLCGDTDRSGGPVDLNDFALFANCFGLPLPSGECDAAEFMCSDVDRSGMVDLSDFATFALLYGLQTTNVPPNCLE